MGDKDAKSLDRYLGILTVLQGGGQPTADELAERFGVHKRTIYRDINRMEALSIPIVRNGGRYYIMEHYNLPPVHFTQDEVMSVVAALSFARRRSSMGGKAAESALDKLKAKLSAQQKDWAHGLEETFVVDPLPAYSSSGSEENQNILRRALHGGHPVRIRYLKLGADTPSERTVRPYGLVYRGTGLYLIGFCELRQELRTFRVSRVLKAEIVPTRFERPADFDLEEYLTQIWGIENGPEFSARIRFSRPVAQLAVETIWHPTQQVELEPDGSVILSMRTRGINEVARWLAGYGGSVEILAPAELREAVYRLGQEIVSRYQERMQT